MTCICGNIGCGACVALVWLFSATTSVHLSSNDACIFIVTYANGKAFNMCSSLAYDNEVTQMLSLQGRITTRAAGIRLIKSRGVYPKAPTVSFKSRETSGYGEPLWISVGLAKTLFLTMDFPFTGHAFLSHCGVAKR